MKTITFINEAGKKYKFEKPDFDIELYSVKNNYIFGWTKHVNKDGIVEEEARKWNTDGYCYGNCDLNLKLIPNWQDIDTHFVMTKENDSGFAPIQKFKIAWTKEMKRGLEVIGWRLATKAEVLHLRFMENSDE